MHEAIVAGLIAYAIGATAALGVAIDLAVERKQKLRQAEFRETIANNLLRRRRRRETGAPQPRNDNGQFTAA